MDNHEIARQLRQTADLLEVAGEDSFRIRSYRKAADVVDTHPVPLAPLADEPKRLLAIPGIGRTMCGHIVELARSGELGLRLELLARFQPGMLDLLQVSGLGPKTVALIWATYRAGTLDEVEALCRAGKLHELPRLGAKAEEKILRGILAFRQLSGRYRRDQAMDVVQMLQPLLEQLPGVEAANVAGSFRRGRDTIGDLDFVLTGAGFPATAADAIEGLCHLPRLESVVARGENKVSIRLHEGLQVDFRLLPPASRGAAMQYFTGSQSHNVRLRALAQQHGLKLNEYSLASESDGSVVAAADEASIYAALGLDFIPPELREDQGEFDAASGQNLPRLIESGDIRGDLHMHTTATDGRASILEMAAAAADYGYHYIAITDHSQALSMTNGLDETRTLEHLARIRESEQGFQCTHPGFRILAGIEVDILADGRLDLRDDVLAQLDVVIGSIHSHFEQSPEECTRRILRAVANPHLDILGHPSGRLLLRRAPYQYDFEAVTAACANYGVTLEINASPERLDLNETQARRCQQLGLGIVINTDAHHPRHLANIAYGISTARRAWLQPSDVLNTLPADELLRRLHRQG